MINELRKCTNLVFIFDIDIFGNINNTAALDTMIQDD